MNKKRSGEIKGSKCSFRITLYWNAQSTSKDKNKTKQSKTIKDSFFFLHFHFYFHALYTEVAFRAVLTAPQNISKTES